MASDLYAASCGFAGLQCMCSLSSGISSRRRCVELLSTLYTGIVVTWVLRSTSCCMFSHYFEFSINIPTWLIVTIDFTPYIAFLGTVDVSLRRG